MNTKIRTATDAFSSLLDIHSGDARAFWRQPDPSMPALCWLGQAGYALRWRGIRLLMDLYLSNSLEKKYAGTDKPHPRMMPPPIQPEALTPLDWVLCSHRHTDHMDAATLLPLAEANPDCRFVVPASEVETAIGLGLPESRLIPVDAGGEIELSGGITLTATPAAHETRELDHRGQHRFLGFILHCGETTIFHSGDTVPFPDLTESVKGKSIDLALLPVNGRGKGVPGNFTFAEALDFCRETGIPRMIPHHFGMFAFNTVDPAGFANQREEGSLPYIHVPDTGSWLQFRAADEDRKPQ